MASDRYLRFDVRRPQDGRALLWPVHVWKILYPEPRVLKLNLFQGAILGLARAGCRESSEMAELLALDRELVAFIIATQLVPNGWMNSSGAVTPQGERVLEEDREASEEVRVGYAFQEALFGQWLPRIAENLPDIEARKFDERGHPVFLRSLNSGKEDCPFCLSHRQDAKMDVDALFDAYRQYWADYEHAKLRGSELITRVVTDKIGFVEDSPQPMWLWTWVFPDSKGAKPWLIADPFGLQQAASWLRKPLQNLLPYNNGLARYVAGVVGGVQSNDVSAEAWLRSLENEISLTVLVDYNWSRKVPAIEGHLISVLRRIAQLESQDSNWQEDVTSLLIETHNLAEGVFQWLLKKFPVDDRRLPGRSMDRNWTRDRASEILRMLPVSPLEEDAVKRLASQSLRDIRTALISGNSSLKALMFAALLSTVEHVDHPLRNWDQSTFSLSGFLDMADARNRKAGHAGGERIGKEEAMKYANFVVEWAKVFKDWY